MNSSTSCCCSSRKYSAMVSAARPTRSRVPGGSSIWPKTSAVSLMTPDSVISTNRSLPSRVRSPTPANTETPAPRCDPGDHLLDEHGLAHAGAAEQADLAAADVGGQQVEHLDPGLQDLGPRLELVERRRVAVDPPALGDLQRGDVHVQRLAEHVEHVALGDVADRHRDGAAGVRYLGAADQAVGGLHGDRADHVVTDVLGDLEGQGPGLVAAEVDLDVQRVVDARDAPGRELDVDDGPDDAHHAAGPSRLAAVAVGGGVLCGCGHVGAH